LVEGVCREEAGGETRFTARESEVLISFTHPGKTVADKMQMSISSFFIFYILKMIKRGCCKMKCFRGGWKSFSGREVKQIYLNK
jgi:hypothetical protein